VAEKLDYVPGVFRVERHVHGEWTCGQCETIVQAPKAVHDIDKGIPNTGLLTQVLVAKHADHQPLYRQEAIRRHHTQPVLDALHEWMLQRQQEGSRGCGDGQGAGLQPAPLGGAYPVRR
jgi:transposase